MLQAEKVGTKRPENPSSAVNLGLPLIFTFPRK
jgi:hypothetical protein